ncbi:MAG: hypothetical protein MUC36_00680 [Planctomycetes bacterium]|nr:hypothetical protein [Planctomycetota bacterium]
MLSRLLHVPLFLTGLFGTAAWLHWFEPTPFLSWARQKTEHVVRGRADYDTLFLGSSRLNFGLDPIAFDTKLNALGSPSKSFNLALSGHRQHDVSAVVSWLLANKPAGLRRVVIELHSFAQSVRAGDWMSDQELEMHMAGEFLPRCRSILLSTAAWSDKLLQFRFVLAHSSTNVLRIGQATRILDDWLALARGEPLPKTYPPQRRGWSAIEELDLPHVHADHDNFVSGRVDCAGYIGRMVENICPDFLEGGFNLASARAQAAALRAAGIEPTYVVMPSFSMSHFGRDGVNEFAREARVLQLDRPELHRPLYDLSLYFDASHFNTAGAALFSSYLAELIAECEDKPVDYSPKPRILPSSPMALAATLVGDGIELRAENLPFVGDLVVAASTESADQDIDGLRMRVGMPPRWICKLSRKSPLRAEGRIEAPGLSAGATIYLQLSVLVEQVHVAVSDLVTVGPR